MKEFVLANVFGAVAFCVAFVPAAAYFMVYGFRQARPELKAEEVRQCENLKPIFVRDMIFICIGIAMLYVFFVNESIMLYQTVMLLGLFILYVIVVVLQ